MCRDHFVYGPSQWEMTLRCNDVTSSLIGWAHPQMIPACGRGQPVREPCVTYNEVNRDAPIQHSLWQHWFSVTMYHAVLLKLGQFSPKSSQNTPPFVGSNLHSYCALVTKVWYCIILEHVITALKCIVVECSESAAMDIIIALKC